MARFLQGNIAPLNTMQLVLISLPERLHFHPNNIRILTDDQHDRPQNLPTVANIVSYAFKLSRHLIYVVQLVGMRWLVEGTQPGDSLFLYCKGYISAYVTCPNVNLILVSGHAIQIEDKDFDELDWWDECSWFYFFVVH
jgi:hypothetical protein